MKSSHDGKTVLWNKYFIKKETNLMKWQVKGCFSFGRQECAEHLGWVMSIYTAMKSEENC